LKRYHGPHRLVSEIPRIHSASRKFSVQVKPAARRLPIRDEVVDIESLRTAFSGVTESKKDARPYYVITNRGQLTDLQIADPASTPMWEEMEDIIAASKQQEDEAANPCSICHLPTTSHTVRDRDRVWRFCADAIGVSVR
jgi:hypothetical protein